MKTPTFTVILFVVAAALFFLSLFSFVTSLIPLESKTVYASVTISEERAGFDVNGTALTFGIMQPGGSVTRAISVSNPYAFPIVMRISTAGPIAPLLFHTKALRLDAGETERVSFSVLALEGVSPGFYEGDVTFTFYPSR